ncbi:Hsp33 family molecular chaperone HslO [Burkholderiaceae bacterium DAT-1]|nr:Hsp33 family molecular chaperone HslO [Burkholderiaceae bacterium DAT-1]
MSHDTLQRFLFDSAPVRGEVVQLKSAWQAVQSRREYPQPLQTILGELMASAALLSAMLKFNGSIVMQLHGNGHLKLAVVECESDLTLRATARWDEEQDFPDLPLAQLLGDGKFVITLDPRDGGQTYQGIVGLSGTSIAAIIEHYMQTSEQLDTRLWLACDNDTAAGFMLQKLPAGQGDPDAWNRLTILGDTIKPDELLSLPPLDLLHRLFHEETVRVMAEDHPHFGCRCSREKVGDMLKMVGKQEADAIIAERGSVDIHCDFCNQHYGFDAVDVAHLFTATTPVSANDTRH